jgi:hypothetical protein
MKLGNRILFLLGMMISALMVTRDRLALARRAIDSWAAQDWARRELVVVSDGEPRFRRALERYVDERGIAGVRFVWEADGTPLGRLRNRSMDEAAGQVLFGEKPVTERLEEAPTPRPARVPGRAAQARASSAASPEEPVRATRRRSSTSTSNEGPAAR